MTLQHVTIGVLFALSLVTLSLSLATMARADEVGRTFVAQRLHVTGSDDLAFHMAPESWSRSVHELAAMLKRVRDRGSHRVRPPHSRVVTLADAVSLPERRRELVEELELTVD